MFAHGVMGRWIDPSWTHWAISCSSQCSTTGVTKVILCAILLLCGMVQLKYPLLLIGKSSGGSGGPLLLCEWSFTNVWRYITVLKCMECIVKYFLPSPWIGMLPVTWNLPYHQLQTILHHCQGQMVLMSTLQWKIWTCLIIAWSHVQLIY